jgi:uncharacterized membrane protein
MRSSTGSVWNISGVDWWCWEHVRGSTGVVISGVVLVVFGTYQE